MNHDDFMVDEFDDRGHQATIRGNMIYQIFKLVYGYIHKQRVRQTLKQLQSALTGKRLLLSGTPFYMYTWIYRYTEVGNQNTYLQ